MKRARRFRSCMVDLAKAIHEAIGIESPRLFIALFALLGLAIFGLLGWMIDRGYRIRLREQSVYAVVQQNTPPVAATGLQRQRENKRAGRPAKMVAPQEREPGEAMRSSPKSHTVRVQQHSEGANSPNTAIIDSPGATVYHRPPELVLTEEQQKTATGLLARSPASVRLVLPSRVANMADGRTTQLGDQILKVFATWSVQLIYLGTGPISPGITLVGRNDNDVVQRVVRAFDAAKIPYGIDPGGADFSPSPNERLPLTVTVSRTVE